MSGGVVHSAPSGLRLGRLVKALAMGRGDVISAHAFGQGQAWGNTPEVVPALKAMIAPLSQQDLDIGLKPIALDLIELQRPMTLIGRLGGMQRVPFHCHLAAQQIGGMGAFVEEGKPMAISAAGFENVPRLDVRKLCAGIVVSDDLVQVAAPGSEAFLANSLASASSITLDRAFVAPDNAGAGAAPASITYGAVSYVSGGASLAAIDADLVKLLKVLTDGDCPLMTAAWLMAPRTATYLSLLRGSGGALAFPGMTAKGGTLLGLPVLTSRGVESIGSPSEGLIALVEASEIALADDGVARIDVATHATMQMDTAPAPGPQQTVSLWQLGLAGIKATRLLNWVRLRDRGVAVLTGVTY